MSDIFDHAGDAGQFPLGLHSSNYSNIPDAKRITQEEYLDLRAQTILDAKSYLILKTNEEIDNFKLTCDDCPLRFTCEFAADLYNTNGDCLAEK